MWISCYRCVLNRHPGLHAFHLVHIKCDVFECLWPLSAALLRRTALSLRPCTITTEL
jgi:hypothetical protein